MYLCVDSPLSPPSLQSQSAECVCEMSYRCVRLHVDHVTGLLPLDWLVPRVKAQLIPALTLSDSPHSQPMAACVEVVL